MGLSKEFFDMYFGENEQPGKSIYADCEKYYRLKRLHDDIWQASNWYKLAYNFTVDTVDNRSRFAFYHFTDNGTPRKHLFYMPQYIRNAKGDDAWSDGIIQELSGLN